MVFPSLPSGMDRVLKEHFDSHRKQGIRPAEISDEIKGDLFQDLEKLDVWRNNFKGLRYTDPKSGMVLMGALDDLFVTSDGKYVPLDFKTRGFPLKENTHEHYQNQMDIYSFLLEQNGMESAGFAILIFYHPKSVDKECNVDFQPDLVKVKTNPGSGKKLFLRATDCLLSGKEPEAGEDCPFCNWKR